MAQPAQMYLKSNRSDVFHDALTKYTGHANHSEDWKEYTDLWLRLCVAVRMLHKSILLPSMQQAEGIEKHIVCQPLTLVEHMWGLDHLRWEDTGETGGITFNVWILGVAQYDFSSVFFSIIIYKMEHYPAIK